MRYFRGTAWGFLTVFLVLLGIYLLDNGLYYLTPQYNTVLVTTGSETSLQGPIDSSTYEKIATSDQIIRITNTSGGDLGTLINLRQRTVIIDGRCVSACVWLLVTSNNICFTENAEFYFHAWHTQNIPVFFNYQLKSRQLRKLVVSEKLNVGLTISFILMVREPIRSKIQTLTQSSSVMYVPTKLFIETYPDKVCI